MFVVGPYDWNMIPMTPIRHVIESSLKEEIEKVSLPELTFQIEFQTV
jgi:hypothetical protein